MRSNDLEICHIEDSSSEDEPQSLPESDLDMHMEIFSDLVEPEEFEADLTFGKDDFCVVQFPLNVKSGIKHYIDQILK